MRAEAKLVVNRVGLVVLLDALGTKSTRSEAEWQKVANRRTDTLRRANRIQSMNVAYVGESPEAKSPSGSYSIRPSVYGFSDTLLLTFEADDYSRHPEEVLEPIAFELSLFFVESMSQGDVFRGAMSWGKYYEGDRLLTGPAILEAAEYYDVADWAGVVLTPETGRIWAEALAGRGAGGLAAPNTYLELDVPISSSICGKRLDRVTAKGTTMWSLNWGWARPIAQVMAQSGRTREERLADIITAFGAGPTGPEGERKLENTLRTFEEMWKRRPL